ncbi:AraC family transcriptional regulator [Pelagibacterium lentulum]|uniref:AraC family transcriptional regulator n=2 Tax=Pelagibacterium lentulum TaxID=2029865 RepID=A0A916VUU6_9HYPH|nr:AraC family transcriptional regulator [Pelagibacterium lentulum]
MGMRLRGASYSKLLFSPPFGVSFPPSEGAQFHFVASGQAILKLADSAPAPISSGDAILLPGGREHAIVSNANVRARPLESFLTVALCEDICTLDAHDAEVCRSKDVLIFTARMDFEMASLHPLIELMPDVLRVSSLVDRQPEIRPLLEAMDREMQSERAGTASILARLADVLAALVVRGWIECDCGDATGWVSALRDERLGRVLSAVHRDPGHNWTLSEMAGLMGSSRSVFAERFAVATGYTPLRYVTAVRMRLAMQWIVRDRMPIELAARRLGYQSHAAFSRAYKRFAGHAPGQARHLNNSHVPERAL